MVWLAHYANPEGRVERVEFRPIEAVIWYAPVSSGSDVVRAKALICSKVSNKEESAKLTHQSEEYSSGTIYRGWFASTGTLNDVHINIRVGLPHERPAFTLRGNLDDSTILHVLKAFRTHVGPTTAIFLVETNGAVVEVYTENGRVYRFQLKHGMWQLLSSEEGMWVP